MSGNGNRITSMLTDQQRLAITAEGVSVALSAGAGCGKTFVLTERFLAELEPHGDTARPRLGQLIAITFTERAAREMRDRIRKACQKRLQQCVPSEVSYWLNLLRELDAARISTIHAFCASLLRSHAVEAGVNPRFEVLDGAQADILLLELTDEVLRSRLADRDEPTLDLATRFNLDRLRDMTARLLAARQEIDWNAWRQQSPAALVERWAEFWRHDTIPRLLRQVSQSADARTVLDLAMRFPPDHPTMRQRCDLLLERLPKLAECQQPAAELSAIREAAKVQGGGTKRNWISEEVFAQFRDAAKNLRDTIDRASKCLQFDTAAAEPAAAAALQVLGLAADVAQQYESKKRELDVLDFNDLLVEARKLLVGPERRDLRRRLASQIRLLLVDEFQDTDPLQLDLVKALCNDEYLSGKLFLVGDYKQSIYRFRGADPHVFRNLREEIPPAGQLPLSLNFRSQPAILDFVNALFCEELGPCYEPLHAHRPQVSPTPAVEFLWACPDQNELPQRDPATEKPVVDAADSSSLSSDDMGQRERLRRCEADWIARRIRGILDAGEHIVWDEATAKKGTPTARAARPGDIALLFRALTNVEYYEEALRRYGIDYYLVGGHAFYSQQEVYDLLNLLRALNSPCDEVSLFGVLRSPMFGLTDETLFWLFLDREKRPQGVLDDELPETIEAEQRQRAAFALETLRDLQAIKDRLPVAQLIHEALRRTGYDATILAEFLGERKLANLHKLIEQARSFDHSGIFSLSDFITQLSEFVARQPDEALAATNPETTDVVRLMSIHQSKGLEFPIVVLPDLDRPRLAAGPSIAFRPELGPVVKDPNATTGYDFLMAREGEEDLAEMSRLLYVATTRAADYLILSAGVEQPIEPCGPWMQLLARHFDLLAGQTPASETPPSNLPSSSEPPPPKNSSIRITTVPPSIRSKPVDLRQRRDLSKIIEKALQMARDGAGRWPRYIEPVPPDTAARRQYSFSRLSGKLHARTPDVATSRLDADLPSQQPHDSRGFGTLIHAVLEEIDVTQPADVADLVHRLASQHLAPGNAANDAPLAVEMVERFLASPRATQLAGAKELHRELEFLLAWPPGTAQANGLYLQGFLDCLFCDASGQWHLLDYKTNQVTFDGLQAAAARYEMQMLVYGLAAETILSTPPAELTICFLRPGLEYCFPWNGTARRRAVELVDQALSSSDRTAP